MCRPSLLYGCTTDSGPTPTPSWATTQIQARLQTPYVTPTQTTETDSKKERINRLKTNAELYSVKYSCYSDKNRTHEDTKLLTLFLSLVHVRSMHTCMHVHVRLHAVQHAHMHACSLRALAELHPDGRAHSSHALVLFSIGQLRYFFFPLVRCQTRCTSIGYIVIFHAVLPHLILGTNKYFSN